MTPLRSSQLPKDARRPPTGNRFVKLSALCTLCLTLLLGLACTSQVPPSGGIEGQVTIGPLNPVSRPGEVDSRPYSAEIVIRRVSDDEIVAEVRSGEDGTFRIPLEAGLYRVEPRQGSPLPIASSQEVTVVTGQFTPVEIDYDSGIR